MAEILSRENAEHIDYQGKKIGMWIFLFTEMLLFGGMFLLYSVFRSRFPGPFHAAAMHEDIVLGSINTAVLLSSSCAIALSISAIKKGNRKLSAQLQLVTILSGLIFLIIKYFEWTAKIDVGIYPDSPVLLQLDRGQIAFFGLYYVMTGIHGLHVLVGAVVISVMLSLTLRGGINRMDFIKLENTGLYWHFVDIVWIYLFPLFYLVT
jgi:cytochrome c oxidase subunit 3